MFMENFVKDILNGKVIYSMDSSRELFEALEVYHNEGYKLAAGYNAEMKKYYMVILR